MKFNNLIRAFAGALVALTITGTAVAGPGPHQSYAPVTTMDQAHQIAPGTRIAMQCGNCGGITTFIADKSQSYLHSYTCASCKKKFVVRTDAHGTTRGSYSAKMMPVTRRSFSGRSEISAGATAHPDQQSGWALANVPDLPSILLAKFLRRLLCQLVVSGLLLQAGGVQARAEEAAELVQPLQVIADPSLPKPQAEAQMLAARRYDTFWNTGEEALAKAALAPDFTDRTLPVGRVQGLEGPLNASKFVRAAGPDLRCEIEQMIVAGDRVVVHLHFRGHFTGSFKKIAGRNQTVDFIATDIYRVVNGRIAENWHLEDNLTFLQQLGAISRD